DESSTFIYVSLPSRYTQDDDRGHDGVSGSIHFARGRTNRRADIQAALRFVSWQGRRRDGRKLSEALGGRKIVGQVGPVHRQVNAQRRREEMHGRGSGESRGIYL